MNGFWGFHSEAQGVKNKQRLLDYHARVKPRWSLLLDGDGLAREIKTVSPRTNVIVRHYFKDGTWYGATPDDYLNYLDRANVSYDFFSFVENESGINPDWNIALIQANAKRSVPRKLVILNLAVGTPADPAEWQQPKVMEEWQQPKAMELLRLCSQYREHIVIGLHEYFNVVVTSGFIGGAPNSAGVPIGKPGGRNLIPKSEWPAKDEQLTHFHMGRFEFLVNACKLAGITLPRVVLTEAGADDVSDIKAWAETLVKTPPYTSIRGWRSLVNQWALWYRGVSADRVYADMLDYAARTIYDDTIVEGGCLYCFATPDPQWEQFNVEGYEDFLGAMEIAGQTVPPVIDKPVVIAPPAPPPPVLNRNPEPPAPIPTVDPTLDKLPNIIPIDRQSSYARIADLYRQLAEEFTKLDMQMQKSVVKDVGV